MLLLCIVLLCLHGGQCVKLLLTVEDQVCIFNTESGLSECHVLISRQLDPDKLKGVADYHYNKKYVYYLNNQNSFALFRISWNSDHKEQAVWNAQHLELDTFALDWYHDRLYLVEKGGKRVTTTGLDGKYHSTIINIQNITNLYPHMTNDNVSIIHLSVDPYKGLIFFSVVKNSESSYIFCSDLEGGKIRLVKDGFRSHSGVFQLEVGDKKLFMVKERHVYIYDYNGNLIKKEPYHSGSWRSFLESDGPCVQNELWEIYFLDRSVTVTDMIITCATYPKLTYFKLYDVFTQRKKERGEYVCDRVDCSDKCEVLPKIGDTCYCSSRREVGPDGTTCLECGVSNLTTFAMDPLIVDGRQSRRGDFPWHAIIYHRDGKEYWKAECGGTLITPRAVLTAAHCVTVSCDICTSSPMNTSDIMIALGKTKRLWNETEKYEVKRSVKQIIVHGKYEGFTTDFSNDIALVELETEVPFTNYVMPACVDYKRKYLGQTTKNRTVKGYVAGFGNTEECIAFGTVCDSRSLTLRHTSAFVMNYSECVNSAQAIAHSFHIALTSNKFCIGNGTISSIQRGDSGGGMTFVFGGLHYVYGVVSTKFIKTKGIKTVYSFASFTDVSEYLDWIKDNLAFLSWTVSNLSEY